MTHPIAMTSGELAVTLPEPVTNAAIEAIRQGYTGYSPVEGLFELRRAIAALYKNQQADIGPENVMITYGARQAVFNVLFNILKPGDEVILPTPYWFAFPDIISLTGGTIVRLQTTPKDNYHISAQALERLITPQTKIFVFSNPCNPTGRIYSSSELEEIVSVLEKYPDIHILSDEIYEFINYGFAFNHFGRWQGIADRLITVSGFSKSFAMSGWRVGYVVASEKLIQRFKIYQDTALGGVSVFAQKAALAAIENKDAYLESVMADLHQKRDEGMAIINTIPGLTCAKPQGAYYFFPDLSAFFGKKAPNGRTINNTEEMIGYLFADSRVQVLCGDIFGAPGHVRISFGMPKATMLEGLNRIKNALLKLH